MDRFAIQLELGYLALRGDRHVGAQMRGIRWSGSNRAHGR